MLNKKTEAVRKMRLTSTLQGKNNNLPQLETGAIKRACAPHKVYVSIVIGRWFETVDREISIKKIKFYGVRDKVVDWIVDYLRETYQMTKLLHVKDAGGIRASLYKAYRMDSLRPGTCVGTDKYGNKYYENRSSFYGRNRWVEYAPHYGLEYDGSQVPPLWYGWLHNRTDLLPECDRSRPNHKWMTDHTENLTGTPGQYMPYSTTRAKIEAWQPPTKKPNDGTGGLKGDGVVGGGKRHCPATLSRLRVEKIEGGLMVAGVVVAANCQIILPIFGFLFLLVGCVLTAASYRGPGEDEEPDHYAERIAFTGNSRILGPACMVVGFLMLISGCVLCVLTRRARRREQTVGFHCPLHGDFYPLSPLTSSKTLEVIEKNGKCTLCWPRKRGPGAIAVGPPQCPHSQVSSTRSSIASSPHSQCPTPLPFLVTTGATVGAIASVPKAQQSPVEQSFGSIRSLTLGREVASFPMSRTPTPPPNPFERSQNMINIPDQQKLVDSHFEVVPIHRDGPRKSVSIVLPVEEDK